MTLVRKVMSAAAAVVDEALGLVEADVNSTGVVDEHDDLVMPGAFDRTLASGRLPAVAWMHDPRRLCGQVLSAVVTPEGKLRARMQFDLDTPDGSYAYKMVSRGRVREWSVGFDPVRMHFTQRAGKQVTVIEDLDWVEVSPVLRGASPATGTLDVKAAAAVSALLDRGTLPGAPAPTTPTTPDAASAAAAGAAHNALDGVVKHDTLTGTTPAATLAATPAAPTADPGQGTTPPAVELGAAEDAAASAEAIALLHLAAARLQLAGVPVAAAPLPPLPTVSPSGEPATAKEGRRNSSADMRRIQDAHDLLTDLGALCPCPHMAEPGHTHGDMPDHDPAHPPAH